MIAARPQRPVVSTPRSSRSAAAGLPAARPPCRAAARGLPATQSCDGRPQQWSLSRSKRGGAHSAHAAGSCCCQGRSRRGTARDGQRLVAAAKPADVMESVEDKVHEATGAVSDVQDKVRAPLCCVSGLLCYAPRPQQQSVSCGTPRPCAWYLVAGTLWQVALNTHDTREGCPVCQRCV